MSSNKIMDVDVVQKESNKRMEADADNQEGLPQALHCRSDIVCVTGFG